MALNIFLLVLMVIMAVCAVMARSLLKAAIGLAAVSAIVTIFMFRFNCPLAGVFELSVCTGLITVIFLSTIGLTKPLSGHEQEEVARGRLKKYGYLPALVVLSGVLVLCLPMLSLDITFVQKTATADARHVLWNSRQLDLLGQIVILLAGGFGAVILFREREDNDW